MKIAIEGMDGSGKTYIAKNLAEKLNFKYVDKPFKFLFRKLNMTEDQIKDMEWELYKTEDEAIISLFYGLGLLYGTRCQEAENIVYDRHYASNYYWHGNEETDILHKSFYTLGGIPDITILLKASVQTRMQRISLRDKKDRDLSNSAMYDDGYEKIEQFLIDNGFPYIVIDTENITKEEVLEIVLSYINELKKQTMKKELK